MTYIEAVRKLKTQKDWFQWIRPVSWKGWRQALCLSHDGRNLELVPGSSGGSAWAPSDVDVILGKWESVNSKDVCDGK